MTASPTGGIDLYWIPLGSGGSGFVRFNGRVYERLSSWMQRRPTADLFHTALAVIVPEGEFIVETMWPSPPGDPASRGVIVAAPVFSRWLGGMRTFTYEVRRWRNGVLPDADNAVGGPQRVAWDADRARALLAAVDEVPGLVWGRDPGRAGEMWNSNSVVSWLLARSGVAVEEIVAPDGGRAPGWDAGIAVARARRLQPG